MIRGRKDEKKAALMATLNLYSKMLYMMNKAFYYTFIETIRETKMKLFHGSYSSTAPEIKIGAFAMYGDNVFDGIFASSDADIAGSHGAFVHSYNVESIADNSDFNSRIEDVIEFLKSEIEADDEEIESLSNAIADDECDDSFSHLISPRSCTGDAGWEMQRLRGRVAAHLGFDAAEMDDEHGTSYLIVNPEIIAE